jgi:hypothetical protein
MEALRSLETLEIAHEIKRHRNLDDVELSDE